MTILVWVVTNVIWFLQEDNRKRVECEGDYRCEIQSWIGSVKAYVTFKFFILILRLIAIVVLFLGLQKMRRGAREDSRFKQFHQKSFIIHLIFLLQYLVLQTMNTILLSLNFWYKNDSDEFYFFLSIAGENLTQFVNFFFMLVIAGKLCDGYKQIIESTSEVNIDIALDE